MQKPTIRLILAGIAAVSGVILASVADAIGWRILGVLLGVAVPIAALASLRRNHPVAAMIGMIVISTLVFAIGIPAVALVDPSSNTPGAGSSGPAAVDDVDDQTGLPRNPQALFDLALDHADALVPNGSSTLLQVTIGERNLQLRVYDPTNGNAVYASYSSRRWSSPTARRASSRVTFSRADTADLDLDTVSPRVVAVAEDLRLDPAEGIDDITVARRSGDDLLVAEYSIDRRDIQVDARGRVADTAGAGFLDTMLPALDTALRELRVDPAAAQITRLDFRTIADGSSPIMASSIQNSGGVLVALSSGRYESVTVVPGTFASSRDRNSREGSGFPLAAVTTEALQKARDDLLARHGRPVFDGALVGLQIGPAPGGRNEGPVIRMQVGPSGGTRAVAVYSLDGRFLREGTW